MSRAEIEAIAAEAARKVVNLDELKVVVSESVRQTLIQIGISTADPIEMQKDMQHLRSWRTSMEQVQRKSMLTLITVAISGIFAMLWVGFTTMISKG